MVRAVRVVGVVRDQGDLGGPCDDVDDGGGDLFPITFSQRHPG